MTHSGNAFDQIIQTQNLSSFLQRTQPLLWYPLVPRPPLLLWAADLTALCLPRGSRLDTQHWVCFQPYRLLLGYLQPQCQCLLVLYPEIKIKSGKREKTNFYSFLHGCLTQLTLARLFPILKVLLQIPLG